jgi:hypothetical protein
VLALPWGVALRPFRPDHFAIVLFLPLTLLASWLLWLAARWVGSRFTAALGDRHALAGFHGDGLDRLGLAKELREIVNPATVMVTPADIGCFGVGGGEHARGGALFHQHRTLAGGSVPRRGRRRLAICRIPGRLALVPTVFYGFSSDAAYVAELREWGEDGQSGEHLLGRIFGSLVEGGRAGLGLPADGRGPFATGQA